MTININDDKLHSNINTENVTSETFSSTSSSENITQLAYSNNENSQVNNYRLIPINYIIYKKLQ